jgi:hypothetical protein
MDNTIEIIRYVSNCSIILPVFFYFFSRKSLSASSHIIGLLVIISGLCDGITFILFKKQISGVLISNFYGVSLFGLLSWFYYELFIKKSHNKNYRSILFAGTTVYFMCFIITLVVQGIFQYHDLLRSFGGGIIVTYSIVYFSSLSKTEVAPELKGSSWFVGGIIYYFAISISIFVLFQYLITNTEPNVMRAIWSVHNISNTIKNILFAFGFYYAGKSRI